MGVGRTGALTFVVGPIVPDTEQRPLMDKLIRSNSLTSNNFLEAAYKHPVAISAPAEAQQLSPGWTVLSLVPKAGTNSAFLGTQKLQLINQYGMGIRQGGLEVVIACVDQVIFFVGEDGAIIPSHVMSLIIIKLQVVFKDALINF